MNIKDFTTGVQHIGIPTNDINKTIEFYKSLGFETALRTVNGTEEVAFLNLHNLVIETYQNNNAKMDKSTPKDDDNFTIDLNNIEDKEVDIRDNENKKSPTEKAMDYILNM